MKQEKNQRDIQPGVLVGLAFDQGTVNHQTYGSASFQGVIPLLMPYGEYKIPAIATDKLRLEEMIARLVAEYRNLWENDLDEDVAKKVKDFIFFAAFINPDDDVSTPPMQAFISLIFLVFAMDDIMDQLAECSDQNLKYSEIRKMTQFLIDLCKGVYKTVDDIVNPMAAIQCTNEYSLKLMQLCMESIPNFLNRNSELRQEWVYTLCSYVLLMERTKDEKFSATSKTLFGAYLSGLNAALEFVALIKNLNISEEIRADILFKRMKIAYGSASHLLNDVLGLGRDIRLNQVKDSSILTNVVENGIQLQDAFDNAFKQLCNEINDVRCATLKLRECYWDDQDLNEYINCLEKAVDGQLIGYQQVTRYGDINLHIVEM